MTVILQALLGLTLAWLAACGGGSGAPVGPQAPACAASAAFTGEAMHAPPPASHFPSAGAPVDTALPAELAVMLDARMQTLLRQTGAPAIAAAVELPGLGRWSSTQGLARVEPELAAALQTPFYWASAGKALTAVLVLQLVQEGRLSLDDRLARWFPQIPQAGLITIDHLLTHTSGLATNSDGATPLRAATRAEQLDAAARTPSVFCPGTGVSYSNTGYWLLSLIVEAVEQAPFDAVLQRRIAEPLSLRQLLAQPPQQAVPDAFASGHVGRAPSADPGIGARLGAGNVFATPADMLSVWRAVLTGHLLAPATVQRQWARLYRLHDAANPDLRWWYGQGVMLAEWTDGQGRIRPWLFHPGGDSVYGANATLSYDPLVGAYLAVAVNSNVPSAAVASALLEVVANWRAGR